MTSVARLENLQQWLVEVCEIRTENFSVSVEYGVVNAEFIKVATVEITKPLRRGDLIAPGLALEDYLLTDKYQLAIVVRNQRNDDFQMLKLKLLLWLDQACQIAEMNYDIEKNNQDTYDFFFELNITERSHHDDGKMQTC